MQPAAAPVATDAPPTPRDLARANASRTPATRTTRANFFTGGGAQAPASTGKRQFGLSSQTSSDLIGGPSSPERDPPKLGSDLRRPGPVRHPRQRRARREAGPGLGRGLLRRRERQRRPERGQQPRRPQLEPGVGAAGRLLVRDLRLGLDCCWLRRSTAPSHLPPPRRKALVSLDLSCFAWATAGPPVERRSRMTMKSMLRC